MQSNYEAINALKIGMEKSKFQGREDTTKLIEALEGLEMKAGDDFPQGDKTLRKADHQAFPQEFIFEVSGGTYHLKETVPGDKTMSRRLAHSLHKWARNLRPICGSPAIAGERSAPILKTERLSVRFGGLSALSRSISRWRATKSAPLSDRTALARAHSSIA